MLVKKRAATSMRGTEMAIGGSLGELFGSKDNGHRVSIRNPASGADRYNVPNAYSFLVKIKAITKAQPLVYAQVKTALLEILDPADATRVVREILVREAGRNVELKRALEIEFPKLFEKQVD